MRLKEQIISIFRAETENSQLGEMFFIFTGLCNFLFLFVGKVGLYYHADYTR